MVVIEVVLWVIGALSALGWFGGFVSLLARQATVVHDISVGLSVLTMTVAWSGAAIVHLLRQLVRQQQPRDGSGR